MAESSSVRRRSVLERYRSDIATRPALEQWRKDVPRAVRRAWLERFFSDVMVEKITNESFWKFLQTELPPEVFAHVVELRAPVTQLEQAAKQTKSRKEKENIGFSIIAIEDEVRNSIEAYLHSVTDSGLIDAFADVYINSFDPNPSAVAQFEAEMHEQLLAAQPYLERLGQRGIDQIVSEGDLAMPGAWLDAGAFRLARKPIPQPNPDKPVFAGALVCGSAAIGPRSTKRYPQNQDIDTLLLPSLTGQSRSVLVALEIGLEFLTHASKSMQRMPRSRREKVLQKLRDMQESELAAALEYAATHKREYDMRLLRYPYNMERDPGGAYKLVGPTQRFDDVVPVVQSDFATMRQAAVEGVLQSVQAHGA